MADPATRRAAPPSLLGHLADRAVALVPLDPAAEREARLSILDTLACMLAGTSEPQTVRALSALADGQAGPARAVVGGPPLPVAAAALVDGTAAHALDWDDYEVPGSTHPSAVLLAALMAGAEAWPVTLRDLAAAYAAGYEAIVRLGQALGYGHYERGWHATATLGPIGAALAVARLAGLDRAGAISAMSLAASMAAGLKLQFGTDAKALHAGLAARAGVEAAALAGAGLSAAPQVMEGRHGFLALYGAADSPGAETLDRAAPPALIEHPPLRKPWPSCAYTHRAIDAALALAARPGFEPSAVQAAELSIAEPYFRVSPFTDPRIPAEGRFSVLYCVAAALADGAITPASFAADALARPAPRALMERTRIEAYPLAPGLGDMSPAAPDRLVVRLAGGIVLEESVAAVPGGPARPLDEAALVAKFETAGGTPAQAQAILTQSAGGRFRCSELFSDRRPPGPAEVG